MKLIVGLGNPGLRYRNTRHNVGFLVVGDLAKKYGIRIKKKLYKGLAGEGRIKGEEVLLFLPQNYMNLSGESVRLVLRSNIKDIRDMLVVYDDVDLVLGNIRFRQSGSSGGHKGLMSIIDKLKRDDFPRLKIGIRSEKKPEDTKDFVLQPFLRSEKKLIEEVIQESIEGIETWIESGIEECMKKYNRKQHVLP